MTLLLWISKGYIQILRIIALKLTACVAIAVHFLKGYIYEINLQVYFLLLLKAIFNKILSNFPEIEKNIIAHGNPSYYIYVTYNTIE